MMWAWPWLKYKPRHLKSRDGATNQSARHLALQSIRASTFLLRLQLFKELLAPALADSSFFKAHMTRRGNVCDWSPEGPRLCHMLIPQEEGFSIPSRCLTVALNFLQVLLIILLRALNRVKFPPKDKGPGSLDL